MSQRRILGLILARGGSKRLPGKNVKPVAGKPLVGWSVEQARACARVLRERGLRGVVITLGANGSLSGDEHASPYRVTPVDTTGAGDAFIGAFATFLAGGDSEGEAIRKANTYAALSTLGIGTQSSFATRERFEEVWAGLRA